MDQLNEPNHQIMGKKGSGEASPMQATVTGNRGNAGKSLEKKKRSMTK